MKHKYIFIGDSLTFGYGVKKNENWVSKLNTTVSAEIINKGINGSTSTDMLDRFYQDVLSFSPNKVFLMAGTNDLLCKHSVQSIIDNVDLMIKDCHRSNISVIIGIPPTIIVKDAEKLFMPSPNYEYCALNLPILRENIIKLCKFNKCEFIDFYKLTNENLDNNIFSDGIHLNPNGQDLIFNYAKEYFFDK